MAADLGWMSGHTSSLDITILSILFLIAYIALYTLCSTCFSEVAECPEEKETPPSLLLSVNLEDLWSTHRTTSNVDVSSTASYDTPQVPAGPQHKSHTIVYNQQTNLYSHNRAKSDSYFSREMTPRIPDNPDFTIRPTGSVSPKLPALPPIPPIFYFTTVQVEPPTVPSSFSSSGQQPETDRTVWECFTPPPEDINAGFTETVSEEHPYESIDEVRVSRPSSSSPCDEAEENRWESESLYDMVTETTEPSAATFVPVTDSEKLEFVFPPLQDEKNNPDRTVLYAAVNRKYKSRKSIEEAPVVGDAVVLDEDEAPPVPEKIFD